MMGQETRNKLTDYWKDHDIKKEEEFAILTNIIHQEWSDLTVKDHKSIKSLNTQELARSHERSGTHFYRVGRTLHPPDSRNYGSYRNGRK